MTWAQGWFWADFLSWWAAGRPAPLTWWHLRVMEQATARFSRILGAALLPSIERATAGLVALIRAYGVSAE